MTTVAILITIDTDDPSIAAPCHTEAQAQARKRAVMAASVSHVVEVMSEDDAALVVWVLEMLHADDAAPETRH